MNRSSSPVAIGIISLGLFAAVSVYAEPGDRIAVLPARAQAPKDSAIRERPPESSFRHDRGAALD